ncbi:MAG: hypothetical protein IJO14_04620 [Clostridia bacterium]|nr:hypothetical protein [Clostridia bacterium]
MFRYNIIGCIVAAFGIGLLLGSCFPEKLILVTVSLLLITAGVCIINCR